MSTTTYQQPQTRTRTVEKTQDNPSVLDAALNETERRVQSIRQTAASYLGVPPDKVCDLLRNVWKVSNGKEPLQDSELFMGMSMIARFGLDPVAKEIYVTRDGKGRLLNIIGIDGWVKILDRTDHFDGFEVEMKFDDKGDELLWVETRIFSKTRSKPTIYRAFMSEYMKISGMVAKTIPWHMLRIFSLHHAARLFTPIGGSTVTPEEANWMQAYDDVQQPKKGAYRKAEMPEFSSEFAPMPLTPENSEELPLEQPAANYETDFANCKTLVEHAQVDATWIADDEALKTDPDYGMCRDAHKKRIKEGPGK